MTRRSDTGEAGRALAAESLWVLDLCGVPRVPAWVDRDDLRQAAAEALCRSAARFDAERVGTNGKPVEFKAYALHRMKGAMQDELRALDWVPRDERRAIREAQAAGQEKSARRTAISLDALLDVAPECAETGRVEAGYRAAEARVVVERALAGLSESDRMLLVDLYYHDRPPADIARERGVTPSRISQLKSEALGRARRVVA